MPHQPNVIQKGGAETSIVQWVWLYLHGVDQKTSCSYKLSQSVYKVEFQQYRLFKKFKNVFSLKIVFLADYMHYDYPHVTWKM